MYFTYKDQPRERLSILNFDLVGNYIIVDLNYDDGPTIEFRVTPANIVKWIENHIKTVQDADDTIEDEVIGEQTITCVSGKYSVAINN